MGRFCLEKTLWIVCAVIFTISVTILIGWKWPAWHWHFIWYLLLLDSNSWKLRAHFVPPNVNYVPLLLYFMIWDLCMNSLMDLIWQSNVCRSSSSPTAVHRIKSSMSIQLHTAILCIWLFVCVFVFVYCLICLFVCLNACLFCIKTTCLVVISSLLSLFLSHAAGLLLYRITLVHYSPLICTALLWIHIDCY